MECFETAIGNHSTCMVGCQGLSEEWEHKWKLVGSVGCGTGVTLGSWGLKMVRGWGLGIGVVVGGAIGSASGYVIACQIDSPYDDCVEDCDGFLAQAVNDCMLEFDKCFRNLRRDRVIRYDE